MCVCVCVIKLHHLPLRKVRPQNRHKKIQEGKMKIERTVSVPLWEENSVTYRAKSEQVDVSMRKEETGKYDLTKCP